MSTILAEMQDEQSAPYKLVFDGQGGELFVVYLVNILLTIVTLGIYRFWGKTRIRQYVWSHLRYKGDAFEYTGTGKELFLGFVIVLFVFFVPFLGLSIWVDILLEEGRDDLANTISLFTFLTVIILYPMAIYRAYRYRLSRSLWRGIRFGLSGKATTYMLKYLGYLILQVITLGLASPYATVRLYEYLVNNIWMGSGRFALDAPWKPLMKPFLAFWVGMIATVIAANVFVAALMSGSGGSTIGTSGLLLVIFGIATLCLSYFYSAAMYRHVVSHITFGDVTFSASVKGFDLFLLLFVNMLLLIMTLGIAFPWIVIRILNFMVAKLEIHGEPDFEKISQNTDETPKFGEGLAEAFDIGSI